VSHEDWFKLMLLDSVLSGPGGPGGGNVGNKTSRLYQALVKTELAASVHGGISATIDPYLYSFNVTVRNGRTLEEVEAVLEAQIERVRAEGVTPDELAKAKKQARAAFAYGTESVNSQAYWLARAENFDSYQWFGNYVSKLEAVTTDDVQDVAQRYLRPQLRTVGWFVPTDGK
jgi:zinc protease